MVITGGNIFTGSIGSTSTDSIKISGGTLNINSQGQAGIIISSDGTIKATGGNILSNGRKYRIGQYSAINSNYSEAIITNEEKNIYETKIKLQDVGENKQITKLTTSDNIEYGINDMYTLEDGMLYLYLPTGTRTITITTEDGKTYSGTVETKETFEITTLTQIN